MNPIPRPRAAVLRVAPILGLVALVGCAAPSTDDGPCVLDEAYAYEWVGGLAPVQTSAILLPPDTLRITQTFLFEEEDAVCTHALPMCGSEEIDVGDVLDALEHPDVVDAWTPGGTLVGFDARPMDGAVWSLRKGADGVDAPALLVGEPCRDAEGCRPIPAGLLELRDLLEALVDQQMDAPACPDLRVP